MDKIIVPVGRRQIVVHTIEVLYLEADGKYSILHTLNNRALVICKCLKNIEIKLQSDSFVRIHYKYLVNLYHLKEYCVNSQSSITLAGNINLPIAYRRKRFVKQYIDDYFKN